MTALMERLAKYIDPEAFASEDEDVDPEGDDYVGCPFSERRKHARAVAKEFVTEIERTHEITPRRRP